MRCAVGAGVTRMPIVHVGCRESCATSSEAGSIRRARTATSTCVSAGVACTRALLTPAVRCVGSCLPPCCRTESADARAPPRCPDPHARSASGTRHAAGRSKRIGNEVGHTQDDDGWFAVALRMQRSEIYLLVVSLEFVESRSIGRCVAARAEARLHTIQRRRAASGMRGLSNTCVWVRGHATKTVAWQRQLWTACVAREGACARACVRHACVLFVSLGGCQCILRTRGRGHAP